MKNNILIVLVYFLLLTIGWACRPDKGEGESLTVHVSTPGSLSTLIDAGRKNEITDLTLTGNLNGTDIRYLREMVGRDVNDAYLYTGAVTRLDLSGANIVGGGDFYLAAYVTGLDNYYTRDNEVTDNMFNYCVRLEEISLPNSATVICYRAFSHCEGLREVHFGSGLIEVENYAFAECYVLASVVLPEGVTTIGSSPFESCHALTSVTLPGSITSMSDRIFNNCEALTAIHIGHTTPLAIAAEVFGGLDQSAVTLYVPAGSLAAYQAAPVWGEFSHIQEE